jgi:hypothetical protein
MRQATLLTPQAAPVPLPQKTKLQRLRGRLWIPRQADRQGQPEPLLEQQSLNVKQQNELKQGH